MHILSVFIDIIGEFINYKSLIFSKSGNTKPTIGLVYLAYKMCQFLKVKTRRSSVVRLSSTQHQKSSVFQRVCVKNFKLDSYKLDIEDYYLPDQFPNTSLFQDTHCHWCDSKPPHSKREHLLCSQKEVQV